MTHAKIGGQIGGISNELAVYSAALDLVWKGALRLPIKVTLGEFEPGSVGKRSDGVIEDSDSTILVEIIRRIKDVERTLAKWQGMYTDVLVLVVHKEYDYSVEGLEIKAVPHFEEGYSEVYVKLNPKGWTRVVRV